MNSEPIAPSRADRTAITDSFTEMTGALSWEPSRVQSRSPRTPPPRREVNADGMAAPARNTVCPLLREPAEVWTGGRWELLDRARTVQTRLGSWGAVGELRSC